MKKILFSLIAIATYQLAPAQMVAQMQLKEKIEGLCKQKVYMLMPMLGDQKRPVCPVSDAGIEKRLNAEVTFLKDSTGYNDKGIVNIILNCKGEVVKCQIDNKTQYPELDQQIIAVFNSLGQWKPGKLNGNNVDCGKLWSFEIVNGQIKLK